ncbi:MAG: GNAT family N-acetyltransferase [Flavobacteriales bacterium]|nr:GNAT family N-acetyltransferase [Flavobacteriales bacterium]
MKILETERLYLRELTPEDSENFYLLNQDTEVIKYTGDVAFESIENARTFLENYDHYKKHNLGRWAVINKSDEIFLGWCGLKYSEDIDEYDIGFRFFRKYWNKGYATESAKACIDLGFDRFNISEIVGRVMNKNIGSIRVLEKIGLSYSEDFNFEGEAGRIYKIKNTKI